MTRGRNWDVRVAFVGRRHTDFQTTRALCWGIPECGKPQPLRGVPGSELGVPQNLKAQGRFHTAPPQWKRWQMKFLSLQKPLTS